MMRIQHPQGRCPEPVERLRIAGDRSRAGYSLCAACRAVYEAAPFSFTFVAADTPEWMIRRAEGRLPAKSRWIA